ncbi:hypothetical protein J437_LFUL012367 [Ladona fulva]|uniref:C-type lectin domain-containing protein n=1 Tax=Ladona fulva TaxID=123851 RepID=A0A8K0P4X6_LADFU|nr:hypothetical protein J437_LFUL012367 [Ladona fulva]
MLPPRFGVVCSLIFFLGARAEEDVEDNVQSKLISIGVDPLLCSTRIIHDRLVSGGHGYYFSWENPETRDLNLDWLEARKFCRARCMDLVSLETSFESQYIAERIEKGYQHNAWTSGRKCTFNGCDREDLKPFDVRGWFWTGSLNKLPPTTDRQGTDWSETGG